MEKLALERHPENHSMTASVRSDGATSWTSDQAKLAAECASSSPVSGSAYQTPGPETRVNPAGSTFPSDEFSQAFNSTRDDKTSSAEAHKAKLSQADNRQNSYRYSRLSDHSSIRLLRLMPHDDNDAAIQCQIFEYALQKPSQGTHLYEALSYVWGPENNQQPIYVQSDSGPPTENNGCLHVTSSLHTALLHLRNHVLERILWIDAICINQEDDDEKARQVQFMAKVYSNASRVIVWLGERTVGSTQAFEALRKAAEEHRMCPVTNEPNQHQHQHQHQHQQEVLALLRRSWFERIWVCGRILDTSGCKLANRN